MLYLDNAATTARKPLSVYLTLMKATVFESGNAGRGGYKKSMAAVRAVLDTQDTLAALFNIAKPENIIFTQNATYALNTAIFGTVTDGHIVVTAMEHNSVLRPAYKLGNYTVVGADKNGLVKPSDIENAIRPDTRLIVCTHASNLCGTVQPVKEIGKIAKKHGIPFLIDAAQTGGCYPIDAEDLGADMIAFSGHKGLMGPMGTGALYIKNPEKVSPLVFGGTGSNSESVTQPDFMPDKFHSGTVNSPAIAALGKGAQYVLRRGVMDIFEHENRLAKRFREGLMNMGNVTVYGSENGIANVAFNVRNLDSGEVFERLLGRAAVRAGYHCAPKAHEALGSQKTGAVRASFGVFNTRRDADKLLDLIYEIVKK